MESGMTIADDPLELERELVAACRERRAGAADRVVDEHLPVVHRCALGLTGDVESAEELVQETFLRFMSGIGGFEGRCRISTWLCAIAHRLFLSGRRRARRDVASRRPSPGPEAAPGAEDAVTALQALDEDLRGPAILYYVERRSVGEIAAALALAPTTVKWRLHRAREVLRERLGRGEERR